MARTPSARATSCPMMSPPSAGDRTAVALPAGNSRRERATERLGVFRVLQHERALQVSAAVQPRRQPEVTFEKRTRLAEEREHSSGV